MNLLIVDDEIEIINGIMAGIHWENLGLQSVYKATSIEESMKLFEQEQIDNITDTCEEPLDMEQLQKRPGLVGYIAKDGDSLWSIAKENHTTVEDILRDNHRTDEDLRRGEKILIVKKVELNSYES